MMSRWLYQWFAISVLVIIGLGLAFVSWAILPLIPGNLPASSLPSLDVEGLLAGLMLITVLIGFGKLVWGK